MLQQFKESINLKKVSIIDFFISDCLSNFFWSVIHTKGIIIRIRGVVVDFNFVITISISIV